MNETKFDNEYVNDIKKAIINYISRSSVNINRVTFNLSLYSKFVINTLKSKKISVDKPIITDGYITQAILTIDGGFFEIRDNAYYIKPEVEDTFANKLIYQLLLGARMNIKYNGNRPISIDDMEEEGYIAAMTEVIAEDINGYVIPDFADSYAFNKKVVRMINAIIGYKYSVNTYFKQDETLQMMLYSLSSDTELYKNINKYLILLNKLINTLSSDDAVLEDTDENLILLSIDAYKHKLVNMIIAELYIPYINSVGLDNRKIVRDNILKGFLGANYTNLKLNNENKDSYYWASLINNTVPINNIVTDQAIKLFNDQVIKDNEINMHKIYVKAAVYNSKNDIKEFFIYNKDNNIIVKTGVNKTITEPSLVEEILSYAYINCIAEDQRKKVENCIVTLCNTGKVFKCSLKKNPLDNKMLVAGIKKLADKNGYDLTVIGSINSTAVEFAVKKKQELISA